MMALLQFVYLKEIMAGIEVVERMMMVAMIYYD